MARPAAAAPRAPTPAAWSITPPQVQLAGGGAQKAANPAQEAVLPAQHVHQGHTTSPRCRIPTPSQMRAHHTLPTHTMGLFSLGSQDKAWRG